MKKIRETKFGSLLSILMKISVTQILIATVFSFFSHANSGYTQGLLQRKVTVQLEDVQFREALQIIEQQTGVRFVYSENKINANVKVSLNVNQESLGNTLDYLFSPLAIGYREISRRIVLAPLPKNQSPKVSLPGLAAKENSAIEIRGRITDVSGEPLPGVSVMVKGTSVGTHSNSDGRYQLTVDNPSTVLVFSYVGFVSQEIMAGSRTSLDIELAEDTRVLEEVVVVGFGEQKKVSVTGAVSSVGADEIRRTSSSSLAVSLAGKLPNLISLQSGGGQPGRDDATMYLRGAATMNTNAPLVLIDGVPRDNIRTIDPNEVESVSILKDASATAVFGVRGANGVIIITTKRGTPNHTEFTITSEQSFNSFTTEPERLASVDYMNLRNQALLNDKLPAAFSEETISKYRNPYQGLDPSAADYERQKAIRDYIYPNHDYYREFFKKNASQTRVNVGARGGTDKVGFFINGTYLHQGGNLKTQPKSVLGYDPSSWMDRYSFRSNLDYKVTPFLRSFLNIGAYIEQVNMPAATEYGNDTNWMMRDIFYQAQTILPITPGPVTLEGFGVPAGRIVDPGYLDRSAYEVINGTGYRREVRSNLNSTFGLELDLGSIVTKGLSIKGMISYDSRSSTATQGQKRERLYLADVDVATNSLSYSIKRNDEQLLTLVKGADSRYNINMQGSINYHRTFLKRHNLGAMVLAQRDTWETTAGEIPYNVLGVSGRFTYDYDNRYLAEFNAGYNGSEQFSPSKRFGFFPAVSAGWVLSNEKFLKNVRALDQLKLRASWGKVGNDRMGGARFLYMDNITMGSGPLSSLGLGRGVNQGLLGNPNITWEVADKKNFGVDAQLFGGLGLSFDYFIENRSQILISRGLVPSLQGVALGNLPKVNMGKVNNKGFELEMTYRKAIKSDFSLSLRGNFGMNENKVIYADEPVRAGDYYDKYARTGYPLSVNRGYKIDYSNGNGYFNTQQELDEYLSRITYSFGTPRLGYFKYKDLNNDGIIDDKDMTRIGWSRIPGVTYGVTVGLNYKNWSLTTFFQGVGRYSGPFPEQGVYETIIRGTYFGFHKTAWTQERYENGEQITYPALGTALNTNHKDNDFFVMNRAYTRLRNAEISYDLPKGSLKILGVRSLRIYVSGQNLVTWSRLRMKHIDPENTDSIGYPVTRSINVGFNMAF